ncbi:MAG: prolipoprotein diacylglyceryl transferase [Elusimicrobiales bacterium]|nr:prolipoprotein diacylglyceryl transferase [Elusimicrobiales bacterium]
MHPFLFQIGSFKLPMYGLMIAIGYLAALIYIFNKNKKIGLNKEALSDLLFYILLFGILGGKLFYIITYWGTFGATAAQKITYIFKTFQFGFVFYGGFLLSLAVFFFYTKKKKIPRITAAELIAPALPLAHAFGRLGCFFAGCCYGKPTDSIFGVIFENAKGEIPAALLGRPIHPVQLYEAFGNLIIFVILNKMLSTEIKAKKFTGRIFCSYIIIYGALRFFLEFFRGDNRGSGLFSLSPAQTISIIMATAAIAAVFAIRRKYGKN